jgi:putative ABC transport system ATP-binding protein
MIQTRGLTYAYPGQPAMRFPDIDCPKGGHLLILGPSGTGKTTLLHLLAGILPPADGEIRVGDTPLHALRGSARDHFRGQRIGIVFQRPHFIRSLTALENLLITQSLSGRPADKAHALQLLDRLAIAHKAGSVTSRLSLGEQQRLAIARALVNRPEVIYADEPSSSLDDANCAKMIDLLLGMATDSGANLVVVTHDGRIRERFAQQVHL